MKTMICALLALLGLVTVAIAGNPTMLGPAAGGPPIEGGRDVCWSQPGDPDDLLCSSEVISQFDLTTECANDFMIDHDRTITLARWWGGYWNGETGGEDFQMNLRFYAGEDCAPSELLAEWLNVDGNQQSDGAFFVYHAEILFPVIASTRFWFVAQAADHLFPPQWGRMGTRPVIECDAMFRSRYFSYPDWRPADEWGYPWDASQEFECEVVTGAAPTSWGAVKALYR